MKIKTIDIEVNYIPKETRKKFKLGEYAETEKDPEEYLEDCGGMQPLILRLPIFDEDKKEEK